MQPAPQACAGFDRHAESVRIDRKERRRKPRSPVHHLALQQEAARKLGFNARRTMRLAQQLYEGVDIGEEGAVGLISYMRTDSVNLAEEAVREIREVGAGSYGTAEVARSRASTRQVQERAGSARKPFADVCGDRCGRHRGQDRSGAAQALLTHLEARRRFADEPCSVRHRRGRHARGPDGPKRHVLRANGSTLVKPGYMSVYQKTRTM